MHSIWLHYKFKGRVSESIARHYALPENGRHASSSDCADDLKVEEP